jgi:hypothetical protein
MTSSKLTPKNSTWSIIEMLPMAIDNIKVEVSGYNSEWFEDTTRQNTYQSHKDTLMYQLQFMDYDWYPPQPVITEIKNIFKSDKAQQEYQSIVEHLETLFSGVLVRSEIVMLKANKVVSPHVDGGQMLHLSRRCHIPIITNEDVFFTVLKNRVHMKEGYCYEINNGMPHSVENLSNKDRVHLILDILPKDHTI